MSQAQAERAKQQLYEDTTTRDELFDAEAEVLLQWGAQQIEALAAQEMDDAAFEDAYAHLRQIMTSINRFTGKRTYAAPEELQTYLDQMATEANALGVDVSASQLDAPGAQAADNNIGLIQALTSKVSLSDASTAPEPDPSPTAQDNISRVLGAMDAIKLDTIDRDGAPQPPPVDSSLIDDEPDDQTGYTDKPDNPI